MAFVGHLLPPYPSFLMKNEHQPPQVFRNDVLFFNYFLFFGHCFTTLILYVIGHFVDPFLLGVTRSFNPLALRVSLEGIVCYSHTYKINLGIKWMFTKHLNESHCLTSDKHFSFKCFQENAYVSKIFK